VTCSTTNGDKDGSRADGASKGDKTAELLHEATQLLKRLRVPMNPKLMVMQLGNIETVDDEYILLDSGVTHALRLPEMLMSGKSLKGRQSNLPIAPLRCFG